MELSKSKEQNIIKNNQIHLLSHLKKLNSPEKEKFISQLEKIDFDLASFLYSNYKESQKEKKYQSNLISPIQSQF